MSKKIIIYSLFLIGLIIGAFYFSDFWALLSNFYCYTINPNAGILRLEKNYKDNFVAAENTRYEANFTIIDMQQKIVDSNSLFAYLEKIQGLFSKRDAHFVEMLRIDSETEKLRLTDKYKTFFEKRKKADENDHEAFKVYREGMEKLILGVLAYYKFTNLYKELLSTGSFLSTPEGFTPEIFARFENLGVRLDLQYNEIASYFEKGILPKELVEVLNNKNENVKLLRELNEAYLTNNQQKLDELKKTYQARIKKKSSNELDLLSQWGKEETQPLFEAQDEKHKKSLDLYNQAYIYAKNQNLTLILSIWGDQPPGTSAKNESI